MELLAGSSHRPIDLKLANLLRCEAAIARLGVPDRHHSILHRRFRFGTRHRVADSVIPKESRHRTPVHLGRVNNLGLDLFGPDQFKREVVAVH